MSLQINFNVCLLKQDKQILLLNSKFNPIIIQTYMIL